MLIEVTDNEITSTNVANQDDIISQQQIMQFSDAAARSETQEIQSGPPAMQGVQQPMSMDLRVFTERMFLLSNTKWTTSDAYGTLIAGASFPSDLLAQQSLYDKTKNITYMRGGVRVALRVNGSRFHWGRLMMVWVPFADQANEQHKQRCYNMRTFTSYPHIQVNAADNEVNEMIIPYCLPYNMFSLDPTVSEGLLGEVRVYVLNALCSNTAGYPDVAVSLFAKFENVEFAGYTEKAYTKHTQKGILSYFNRDVVQVGSEVSFSAELSAKNLTLDKMGTPSLAEPSLKLGLRRKKTADDSQTQTTRMVQNLFNYAHQDVVLPTLSFDSPSCSLKLAEMNAAPHEMDLSYLASTPSLYSSWRWPGTTGTGVSLERYAVAPSDVLQNTGAIPREKYSHMAFYTASAFKYWRGNIRYYIQVVCSPFHAGRLKISYDPDVSSQLASNEATNHIHRVLDLQESTDVAIMIPFTSDKPFLAFGQNIGVLEFSVINQLTFPSSPVPPVDINVWISMDPDTVHFAFPTSSQLKSGPQINQIGITHRFLRDADYRPLFPSSEQAGCDTNTETIEDLGLLLSRYNFWQQVVLANDVSAIEYPVLPLSDFTVYESLLTMTFFDWFQQVYACSRGSSRWRTVWSSTSVTDPRFLAVNIIPMSDASRAGAVINRSSLPDGQLISQGVIGVQQPISNALEGAIPWFSDCYFLAHHVDDGTPGQSLNGQTTISAAHIQVDTGEGVISQAVGDDFYFGFLTGPPIITV